MLFPRNGATRETVGMCPVDGEHTRRIKKDCSPWPGGLKNRRPEKELRMIIWPSTPEVVNAICNVASGEFVANYMEQRGAQKVSLLKIGVRIDGRTPLRGQG